MNFVLDSILGHDWNNPPLGSIDMGHDNAYKVILKMNQKEDRKCTLSIPGIVKVVYCDQATTIHWDDGSSTSVKCGNGETYDRYTGFMAAVCKKLFGSTTAAKKIRDQLDDEHLKQVACAAREAAEKTAREKREKREKAVIKRLAKEMVIEMKAKELAEKMMRGTD